MRIARSLDLADETGLDAGLASSKVESRPISCRPLWVWWSHPQSEDAGEVDADVKVVDGDERGVEANEFLFDDAADDGDGLRAVLRRRRPEVRSDEGVNGSNRDEVRIMMYFCDFDLGVQLDVEMEVNLWLMERTNFLRLQQFLWILKYGRTDREGF